MASDAEVTLLGGCQSWRSFAAKYTLGLFVAGRSGGCVWLVASIDLFLRVTAGGTWCVLSTRSAIYPSRGDCARWVLVPVMRKPDCSCKVLATGAAEMHVWHHS